jgi:hypothetical protein
MFWQEGSSSKTGERERLAPVHVQQTCKLLTSE